MNSHFTDKTSFKEKVKLFSQEYIECCAYISSSYCENSSKTRSFYLKLAYTSKIIDDFLKNHNAINNTKWQFYSKMCSMTKHFAMGAYWQKQASRCQRTYKVLNEDYFSQKVEENLSFLDGVLTTIATEVIMETKKLNLKITSSIIEFNKLPSIDISDTLNYDTFEQEPSARKQDIVKIASEFLLLVSNTNNSSFFKNNNIKQSVELIPNKVNTAALRHLEMLINNSLTFFSRCISKTNIYSFDSELYKLKNYLDMISYLLKMAGCLLIFYENCTVINRLLQKKLFLLAKPDKLLYWVVDFGLNHVCILLSLGKKLANEMLDRNIEIASIKVDVPAKFGFHTRPSLLVAKIVQHYGSKVYLEVGNNKFDASSVLNIQWAGGKIQKEKICKVIFSGDARALHDIQLLASINYGEDTMGKGVKMPVALGYLK